MKNKQMKRYFIYTAFAATTLSIASCNKELNQSPPSYITSTNFYTNAQDFAQAVSGAYSELTNFPAQALWLGEMRSDNINAVSDGTRDWDGINNFATNISSATFILNAWDNNLNGIYNVNSTLQALQSKGSVIGNDSLQSRYDGELHFLRGFYYFQLLREFGKVPLFSLPLSAQEVATVPRADIKDVYDFIASDFKYALTRLPASYSSADVGRATSGAANALLGLLYLTKSGPTYDIDGPGLASNQYDSALYYLNQVISSGKYSLQKKYTDIFSYTNENNSEVVFDVQFKSGTNGASFPSFLAPVAYWATVNLPTTYGNGYGASTFAITNNLKTSYEPAGTVQDVRDSFNINYAYSVSPFFKKYIDVVYKGSSGTDWPINFIVSRYADILLQKAEAILNGAAGTQADVDALVNQIRDRAGLSPLSNVTLSQLVEERRREFAGEGLRWNDLVREGLAVTTINNWIISDSLSSQINKATNDFVIYPLPQSEISTANGLYIQNHGY